MITPKERNFYRYPEWVVYLATCSNNPDLSPLNTDHYKYIKGVQRIRELTDSEDGYVRAYEDVSLGFSPR